jgi:hypothetical protein
MPRYRILFVAFLSVVATSCHGTSRPERMASAAPESLNKSKGEELLTEFWSKVYNPPQDLDAIDRLCTEDFVLSNPNGDVSGRAPFKEWVRSFSGKVRDLHLKSLDMFSGADGTRVVSRWVVTGYNAGILGSPPDDRPIQFTGIAVWEVRNGKLAHNWVERSAYELSQKLAQPAR